MSVSRQHHVVPQLQRLTHCGVDAIVGLQTADDQAFEILHRQQLLQVGLVERIRGGLAYVPILGRGFQPLGKLPALSVIRQRTAVFLMLDQHHRNAGLSGTGAEPVNGVDDT
ncbi:hypothetical protein D3C84_897060 [compost metagenome]